MNASENKPDRRNDADRPSRSNRYRIMAQIVREDREGNERSHYVRCGTLFDNPVRDDGKKSISIRLDTLPLNFNGDLVAFPDDDARENGG